MPLVRIDMWPGRSREVKDTMIRNVTKAVVESIGCPPEFPDVAMWRDHPVASRAALRLLGLRAYNSPDCGPSPADVAARLGSFPKLLVFGEWEVAPPEEIDRFIERVAPPKETLTVAGAWHADLKGREAEIREWFERSL